MNGRLILAAGTLAGTIIGAGVFALPYVVMKVGAGTGFFYLCAAALVYAVVHYLYAMVATKVPAGHDFLTFVRSFLPRWVAPFSFAAVLGELAFTLVVYLALAPAFLNLIWPLSPVAHAFLFWALGSLFMFVRLSWQGFAELVGTFLVAVIVAIVLVEGNGSPFTTPWFLPLSVPTAFLPLGALLFAFAGRSAIVPVVREWRECRDEFSLRSAVFLGTLMPAGLYAVFIFAMLRLVPEVTPEALDALSFLTSPLPTILGFMGLITLWTSYFMIGANLKDILELDFKVSHFVSALVVLVFPLAVYLVGFGAFFEVLSFTGSVFLALDGIFMVWLWRRAFPAHRFRFISIPLMLLFAVALGHGVLSYFGVL
jgi:amino acid permease